MAFTYFRFLHVFGQFQFKKYQKKMKVQKICQNFRFLPQPRSKSRKLSPKITNFETYR
jgi:hypothetical protein